MILEQAHAMSPAHSKIGGMKIIRVAGHLPPGVSIPPPPPVRLTRAQEAQQLRDALRLVSDTIIDVTPLEARRQLRERLKLAAKYAWAQRTPVAAGTLERFAKALEDPPSP